MYITMFKTKYFWFIILIILALVYSYITHKNELEYTEGFSQGKHFVLKTDSMAYDNFYAEIYDIIHLPEKLAKFEYETIINATMPNKETSNMLVVGSGTGSLVNNLTQYGYNAHGIDKSQAMVNESRNKYPDIDTQCACVEVAASYDKNTFTHITCTDYTLYHIKDKYEFFRRCYNWLIPNGYLVVHMVDKKKFTPVKPCVNKILDIQISKDSALKNINKTNVDFGDFVYNVNYDMKALNTNKMIVKETFTDKGSKKVRQNEVTMHIEDSEQILTIARNAGFIQHSRFDLPDDSNQHVIIFERIG
jgi:2-polyprenyl-3-methyl-5-hydroxy-6-metoxy-1,4-benzoquinol methylase